MGRARGCQKARKSCKGHCAHWKEVRENAGIHPFTLLASVLYEFVIRFRGIYQFPWKHVINNI